MLNLLTCGICGWSFEGEEETKMVADKDEKEAES